MVSAFPNLASHSAALAGTVQFPPTPKLLRNNFVPPLGKFSPFGESVFGGGQGVGKIQLATNDQERCLLVNLQTIETE
jgi:hypothetical protein